MDKHTVDRLFEMWESGDAIDPEAYIPHVGELLRMAKLSLEQQADLENERRQHAHTHRFLRQSDRGRHELVGILQHVSRAFIRLRTEAYPDEKLMPSWLEAPEAEAISEGRSIFTGTQRATSRWIEIRRTSSSGKMLCVCSICGRTSVTPDKKCSRPMVGRDGYTYLCHEIIDGAEVPSAGLLRWTEEHHAPLNDEVSTNIVVLGEELKGKPSSPS